MSHLFISIFYFYVDKMTTEYQYMVPLSEIIKKDDKIFSKNMKKLKHDTLKEMKNNDYEFKDVIIDEIYGLDCYRIIDFE